MKTGYLVATAVLVAGALAVVLTDDGTSSRGAVPAQFRSGLVSPADAAAVTRIELAQGERKVELSRAADGRWSVTQADGTFAAAADKVVKLLDDLGRTRAVEHVSSSPSRHAELELETGRSVRLHGASAVVLDATFGKNRGAGGQYARFGAAPEAFLVDRNVTFDLDPAAWEWKKLAEVKEEQVKSVAFTPRAARNSKPASLSRETGEAEFALADAPAGAEQREYEVGSVGQLLANLAWRTRSAKSEAVTAAFAQADRAEVVLFDGTKYVVQVAAIGSGAEGKHYARVTVEGGDAQVQARAAALVALQDKYDLEIDAGTAARFGRGFDDFVEAPEPEEDVPAAPAPAARPAARPAPARPAAPATPPGG